MSDEQVQEPTVSEIVDPYEGLEDEAVEPAQEETPEPEAETPEPETEAEAETEAPVEAEPEVSKDTETSGFQIKLDERLYDPEIVEQFKQMKNHYDSMIAELQSRVASMTSDAEATKAFSMFDELDDKKRFGVGPVKPNSKQGKNRQLVLDEMAALKAGYEATKRKMPSEDQLLRKAINLTFGEQIAETVRSEITEKVTERHNQRIARPNRRVSKPDNKIAEATRNVAALMRDRGLGGATDTFD